MTAALYDNVTPAPQPPALRAQPAPQRRDQASTGGGDPLMSAATRLLTIPMRQVYAVLWRLGVIEVLV